MKLIVTSIFIISGVRSSVHSDSDSSDIGGPYFGSNGDYENSLTDYQVATEVRFDDTAALLEYLLTHPIARVERASELPGYSESTRINRDTNPGTNGISRLLPQSYESDSDESGNSPTDVHLETGDRSEDAAAFSGYLRTQPYVVSYSELPRGHLSEFPHSFESIAVRRRPLNRHVRRYY